MAEVIKVDGTLGSLAEDLTLETMQGVVGGYIEAVYLGDHVMVVDEEGRLKGRPVNRAASYLAQQIIVGDVLLLTPEEWDD